MMIFDIFDWFADAATQQKRQLAAARWVRDQVGRMTHWRSKSMDTYYYLAGPMRGKKLYNMREFMLAAADLRDQGYRIKSPMEKDLASGMDPARGLDEQGFDLPAAFLWDFQTLADPRCTGMVVLPGWEASKGVASELVLAWHLGKRLCEYVAPVGRPPPGGLRLVELEAPNIVWKRVWRTQGLDAADETGRP